MPKKTYQLLVILQGLNLKYGESSFRKHAATYSIICLNCDDTLNSI
jgi:hypothetical protein